MQAWIYGVINPLLDALEVERRLLEAGRLTWRFHSGDLERIGVTSSYLEPEGRINLSDLLRALEREHPPAQGYGDLRQRFVQHDQGIEKLPRSAATYHHSLVNDERFVERVDSALKVYLEEKPGSPESPFYPEPWGSFAPEKLKDLAAENLVNRVYTLPSSRTDTAFWRGFLQRYGQEISRLGAPSVMAKALEEDTRLAAAAARELIEQLERLRSDLSDVYDLPAAPAPILIHAGTLAAQEERGRRRLRRGIVSLAGERAGLIEETIQGSRFTYDTDYIQRPGARPISPTLPLRSLPYESNRLHPVFSNLLPEGDQLELICRRLKIDPGDRFGVMLATCADTIGAIEVQPDPDWRQE